MSDAQIELTDLEPPDVELASHDLIQELRILRELNRRWRRVAIGAGFFGIFLAVVSVMQFAGTFTTCRLLSESRREATANRQLADSQLREMRSLEEKTAKLVAPVIRADHLEMIARMSRSEELIAFHRSLQRKEMMALEEMRDQRRKLLEQLEADVAEAREILISAEEIRLLLEKDEEARARLDPRSYGDSRQRCPFEPNAVRKPPKTDE